MTPSSLTLTRDTPTTVRSLLFSTRAQQGWMLLLVALGVVVTVLACRPADAFQPTLGWDKLNHVVAFMTMAFCGHFAFRQRPRATFWVVFLLMALGLAIELVQFGVPGREADVVDLFADGVGLASGLVLAMGLAHRLDRRKRPRKRSS
jgi:VanZ family protein